MKISKNILAAAALLLCAGIQAQGATTYVVTITNGGQMPLSPAAIYVRDGQQAAAKVGQTPTAGFVQLCQTGNPAGRIPELNADSKNSSVTQTMGPILPGESRTLEVAVHDPLKQSLHVETMYGKTKDVCGVASVGSHSLYALKQHVNTEFIGKDQIVATGAFTVPILPAGHAYPSPGLCAGDSDAVSCLRELALPAMGNKRIHFFTPYFPSVLDFLEKKYGAVDLQSLMIPAAGAIQINVSLKH